MCTLAHTTDINTKVEFWANALKCDGLINKYSLLELWVNFHRKLELFRLPLWNEHRYWSLEHILSVFENLIYIYLRCRRRKFWPSISSNSPKTLLSAINSLDMSVGQMNPIESPPPPHFDFGTPMIILLLPSILC